MAEEDKEWPERESMEFDIIIVGAGPAGLSAAIRLKQLSVERGRDISIVVLEKGSEVGAHILSGAVIDPQALDKLIPNWRNEDAPLKTAVTEDHFLYLGPAGQIRLPNFLMPPLMNNHGNYIGSLGALCRWLATKAEEMGVEIYPGFAASEVLYDDEDRVLGVATGDMGISREGLPKDNFMRGMALLGKYTFFAEGARGSLSKQIIRKFGLDAECEPPKFGLGLKELWQVQPEKHRPGLVQHTMGWPLDNRTGGGSFLYHFGDNLVSVGFVVHLNYENPHLSPYHEFQRAKIHDSIRATLEGGQRISYGARALTEGGWQSIPKLVFPGGALIGCSAGLVNVPRIKGSHNAMASGMLAAESAFEALGDERAHDRLQAYQSAFQASEIAKDLKRVRNAKPLWSRWGTVLGITLGGIDMWLNTLFPFLGHTAKHGKADHETLKPVAECKKIEYPAPDGVLTFDRLTSVSFSATNHEEDQPVHLHLSDPSLPIAENLPIYDEPAQRYCPAGVYEVVEGPDGLPKFQINAQNCIHCKTCDIKDPAKNINWLCPEGAGGPNYPDM